MRKRGAMIGVAVGLLLFRAAAAAEREKESSVELEIGAAGELSLPGGASSFGPSAAIEFTPVKDLEIEIGV
jgi:hypothetical protein